VRSGGRIRTGFVELYNKKCRYLGKNISEWGGKAGLGRGKLA
jgi:hypothetical protein